MPALEIDWIDIMLKKYLPTIGLILTLLVMAACGQSEVAAPPDEQAADEVAPASSEEVAAPEQNLTTGCVENYAEGVDYFPDKVDLTYAEGLTVEYHDHYKVVEVTAPWPGATETYQYVLVQCGTPAPEGFDGVQVVEVPVNTMVSMSTTLIPHLDSMGLLDRLVGLDSFAYVNNPTVREMIDAGELAEIGFGTEMNVEVALDLDPEIIMAHVTGTPEYDSAPPLIEAGLPVVISGDWVEEVPLGRAEWIKYISLFFNTEAQANAVFSEIETQYNEIAPLARAAAEKPTVLADTPYQGTWYIPGGQSYTAQLFEDAGADYIWADDDTAGSLLTLDFEVVFDMAQDADVWVNANFASLDEMAATDERFTEFAAFQNGNVYGHNKRQTEYGNDFFESGAAQPHIVLLDLIKIFHPELVPDHEFYYYVHLQ
jgi:iron complex transport system substrate-binding protein